VQALRTWSFSGRRPTFRGATTTGITTDINGNNIRHGDGICCDQCSSQAILHQNAQNQPHCCAPPSPRIIFATACIRLITITMHPNVMHIYAA